MRPVRRAGIVSGIACLVIGLSGCGAPNVTSPTPSFAAPPSSVAPASGAPPPTVGPTATPAPVIGQDWQRLELSTQIPDGDLYNIAVDERGWIAVGRTGEDPARGSALVLTSPDGLTWTAADPALFVQTELNFVSVAAGPVGRVVIGRGGIGGSAVWRAGLDGQWVRVGLPGGKEGYVGDVTWGDGRFVAVGVAYPSLDRSVGLAWESADGLTWHRAKPFPGPASVSIDGVARSDWGFLAFGRAENGPSRRSAVWSSADGITWSRPTLLPADDDSSSARLAVGPGGVVIVAGGFGGITWISTDGRTWAKEVVPGAGLGLFGIASVGSGFVAVGRSSEGAEPVVIATRASISAAWQAVPYVPDLSEAGVGGLVAVPDGNLLIAVGSDKDRRPVILVSPPR